MMLCVRTCWGDSLPSRSASLSESAGVGEALAAEDGRTLTAEELGHVLARSLDNLLRHGQREP